MVFKYIYVILAHKNPGQVKRLLSALAVDDSSVGFWIHVDKRINKRQFHEALSDFNNIFWVPSVASRWGSFNLVQAVLNALNMIENQCKTYSHVILLSGQDYPIVNPKKIYTFLNSHSTESFIEYQQLPVAHLPYGGWDRFKRWHFYIGNRKFTYPLYDKPYGWLDKGIEFVLSFFLSRQREIIKDITYYYGSQWWIFSREAVCYILQFLKRNRHYLAFFKYTWISDEHFFQTILLNHTDQPFLERMINDNLRYIDWTKLGEKPPAILKCEDFDNIKSSGNLFARKFDDEIDEDILDFLDDFHKKSSEEF